MVQAKVANKKGGGRSTSGGKLLARFRHSHPDAARALKSFLRAEGRSIETFFDEAVDDRDSFEGKHLDGPKDINEILRGKLMVP